jgi:hypothetical protein
LEGALALSSAECICPFIASALAGALDHDNAANARIAISLFFIIPDHQLPLTLTDVPYHGL